MLEYANRALMGVLLGPAVAAMPFGWTLLLYLI
jgi:hypothetical protein